MLNLKILADKSRTSISGDISYGCIYNMYKIDGELKDGEGIQINSDDEAEIKKAEEFCRAITKAVKTYLS